MRSALLDQEHYVIGLAKRYGLAVRVYRDLSVMDWSTETLLANEGGDTRTFTQNVDSLIFDITAAAGGSTRYWGRGLALPQTCQEVFIGAFASSTGSVSNAFYFQLWGNTPSAQFSGANYNAINAVVSTGCEKAVGAVITNLNADMDLVDGAFNWFFASRTNNVIFYGTNEEGRRIVATSDLAYPADSQLAQLTHAMFIVARAAGGTARLQVSAPIIVAYK